MQTVKQKKKESNGALIFISGISGSGKTTLGKRLADLMENTILMDQDSFFDRNKPIVRLSNGEPVVNYDDEKSINWDKLNDVLENNLKFYNVVLVGFALCQQKIKIRPNLHFLLIRDILINGQHNVDNLFKFCYEDRQQSKKIRNLENEKLMIKEFVIPFYFKTLKELGPVIMINCMTQENGNYSRIPLHNLIGFLLKHIPDYLL